MIKVLAISHAYVEPFTRVGIIDKKLYPDIDLTIVVPECAARQNEAGFRLLSSQYEKVLALKSYFNMHQSVRAYGPELYKLLKRLKPDIIVINNEPWSTTAFETILFIRLLKLQSKIIIYTCENLRRSYPLPFRLMERYSLNHADCMLSITKFEGESILRKKGYNGEIVYLPLTVDTCVFQKQAVDTLRNRIVKGNDSLFLIGFIGRLVKEKGIDIILEAIKELSTDIRVVIIGNGPEKEYISSLSDRLGIKDKVFFLNAVNNPDLPSYLNCLDTMILPSLTTANWKEQFGRVLVEAMACEVPVIGSSSGEIPVVIGDAGMIFQEGSVDDLKDKISALFNDSRMRSSLGRRGRERVCANYSRALIDRQTVDLYTRITHESAH